MSEVSKVQCTECITFNGKHVGGVESLFDLHRGF